MVRASVIDLGVASPVEHTKNMGVAARQFAVRMRARGQQDGCANSPFHLLLLREGARLCCGTTSVIAIVAS